MKFKEEKAASDSDVETAAENKESPKPASSRSGARFPSLDVGVRSQQVTVLQHLLALYASGTVVDGIYGDDTARSVSNFQAKFDCAEDGVGDATWAALLAL